MEKISKYSLVILIFFLFNNCRKSDYVLQGGAQVIRDIGGGTGTVTWTSDNSYLLEGKVFVNDGQVLTILKSFQMLMMELSFLVETLIVKILLLPFAEMMLLIMILDIVAKDNSGLQYRIQ